MDRYNLKLLIHEIEKLVNFGSPSCIREADSKKVLNFDAVANFALESTKPKPKPKTTIADHYPAGGITTSEPCAFCEDYEQLESALTAANEQIERLKTEMARCRSLCTNQEDAQKIVDLQVEIERLNKTMELHAGDCCSLNNEVEKFRLLWEEEQKANAALKKQVEELTTAKLKIGKILCDGYILKIISIHETEQGLHIQTSRTY